MGCVTERFPYISVSRKLSHPIYVLQILLQPALTLIHVSHDLSQVLLAGIAGATQGLQVVQSGATATTPGDDVVNSAGSPSTQRTEPSRSLQDYRTVPLVLGAVVRPSWLVWAVSVGR